jgi:hypothetical protein
MERLESWLMILRTVLSPLKMNTRFFGVECLESFVDDVFFFHWLHYF